jgi:transcription antitermination factor NusG
MDAKTKNWHVIYTAPRAEKKVNERLQKQGIETYLPLQKVLRQWSDRKKKVNVPLFNSYIFVKIDRKEYDRVFHIPGFSHFIFYLGKPAVVRQQEIDGIKEFLTKTEFSDIQFETSKKAEILAGPLRGHHGIIENIGKNTIRLRIDELGISLVAEVQKASVRQV